MSSNELDDQIAALLKGADQRYTSSRRRLVAALQAGRGPITIAQIVAIDDSLPQSTVYRNLTAMEEAGVVTRVITNDDFARYELAEQLTGHHHHLICSCCGDVADFSLDTPIEATLDHALQQVAKQAGFTADAHRLDLLGTCGRCS